MNDKMTDAELSKILGRYQAAESIGIFLGALCVIACCVLAFVLHELIVVLIMGFRGVVLRRKDICAPDIDIALNEQFHERKGADLTDPAVFRRHFAARTADGQPADEMVTPQLRALVRRLEEFANNGKVGGLILRGGELTLALNTGYVFANVPNAIDMRDIDGIRKWFTASLNGMAGLLDILWESPALTGHVSQA